MAFSSNLLGIFLAFISAFTWGSGDFCGGLATRKNSQYQVLFWSSFSGLLILLGCALIWRENFPPLHYIIWGILAGIMGMVGISALYRGLSLGQVASVAPLSAVVAVVIPVIYVALTQGLPAALKIIGVITGLAGVWFVSRVKSESPSSNSKEGFLLACLAGCGFAGFFIFIAQFPADNIFIPLVISRSVNLIAALIILKLSRMPIVTLKNNALMIWVGVLDVCGNIFYVLSRQFLRLDMVVVLVSLYPAATVLWARLILKEKISLTQWAGIILCLAAIILISL